jgi:uncharacterized NAD-dependent epimerase/dehydratase family protein
MKPEGNAIVYCEGAFNTPNGKTAHGLVRRTARYQVVSVLSSTHAGEDAGEVLDGKPCGIPVHPDLAAALESVRYRGTPATHMVIGLAPDGGRLPASAREVVASAFRAGLQVDSGLHDFISEDLRLASLAGRHNCRIRDIRKPPARSQLHFFSGKIEQVESLKVAILGTDSAVGKRTTAWILVDALQEAGLRAEMIGTGQTAWMQGSRFCIILDSLVNDFVSGEIEHAVWSAWTQERPDVLVVEGQGSLLNPAYPGGFEILAAARPDVVILQHAPGRREYDGFPGYRIHPLKRQIEAVEIISDKPVVAITLNHEGLSSEELEMERRSIASCTGLPVVDVLRHGAADLVDALGSIMPRRSSGS